jgi:hypothetical protein
MHKRNESADNKFKKQAVINERMRIKNLKEDQIQMSDPNLENMLKKMSMGGGTDDSRQNN